LNWSGESFSERAANFSRCSWRTIFSSRSCASLASSRAASRARGLGGGVPHQPSCAARRQRQRDEGCDHENHHGALPSMCHVAARCNGSSTRKAQHLIAPDRSR
jgi:hypothetical protein